MDRDSLAAFLELGLSLREIGQRVGRDPKTVDYWVRKHGLEAVHRDRQAPQSGLAREELSALVEDGASVAEISERLGVSPGTVRHWLTRFGLRTNATRKRREAQAARRTGMAVARLWCRHHGQTDFWLEGRGSYRCLQCRGEAVARRRRKVKAILVAEAGGRCRLSGYERCVAALQFHHKDRQAKRFSLSRGGVTYALDKGREEAEKCVLLCANCHAEVEAGVTSVDTMAESIRGSTIGRALGC